MRHGWQRRIAGAVTAGGLIAVLAACSTSEPETTSVPAEDVATAIIEQFGPSLDGTGVSIEQVACPQELLGVAGTQLTCSLTLSTGRVQQIFVVAGSVVDGNLQFSMEASSQ